MRRPRSLLTSLRVLLLSLAACGDGAPMTPAVIAGHAPLAPTRPPSTPAIDALIADAADAVARAASPGEIPALFVERTRALAAAFAAPAPPRLEVAPACHGVRGAPVGDGALVPLRLVDAAGEVVWERLAFLRREAAGVRLHERLPRDVAAATRVERTTGTAWVSLAGTWARHELDLTIVADGPTAVLHHDAPVPPGAADPACPRDGARVVALTVDGAPARWTALDDHLIVDVPRPGVTARLHLVVERPLHDQMSTLLARWTPFATVEPQDVDLRVMTELGDRIVTRGDAPPVAAPPGWHGVRVRGRGDVPSVLIELAPLDPPPTREVRAGAVPLRLDPSVQARHLAACVERLPAIAARLPSLGEIPAQRVVGLGVQGLSTSQHDGSLVLMNFLHLDGLCREPTPPIDLVRLFLHELAHVWFGHAVLLHDDEAAAIWESLAEYVAITSLDPADAAELRRDRLREYQTLDDRDDDGLAQRIGRSPQARWVLSYAKGALTVQAIADHVGLERFADVLRRYLEVGRGRLGSWPSLIAAVEEVAGADAAAWARAWIASPGAPTLDLRGSARGGRLRGAIVQAPGTARTGVVEVVIGTADGGRVVHRVAFGPGETPIDLPLPADATAAVLDPDARLPRRVADVDALIPRIALTTDAR